MVEQDATRRRIRRTPKPLDRTRLNDLALAYVARFSTSAGRLRSYLSRKIRERGYEGDAGPDVEGLVERFVENGYVDDEVYGRAKADELLARGYGRRRIDQALRAADIAEDVRDQLAPDEGQKRAAALALARRRRFGPFVRSEAFSNEERFKVRDKQLAAMVRAGHEFEHARRVIDAGSDKELEEWVGEACEEH